MLCLAVLDLSITVTLPHTMSMPPQTSSTFRSPYLDEYQRHSCQNNPVKHYYPQQWPQSHPRPTSDEHAPAPYDGAHCQSDPRSPSDTTMTTSMSPVSSQDESVALPAAAVLPSKTIKSGSTSNCRRSDDPDWPEQARQREMEWGHVKNTLVRQDVVVSSVTSNGSPHRAPGRHRVSTCTESDDEDDENDDDDKECENAFLVLVCLPFRFERNSLLTILAPHIIPRTSVHAIRRLVHLFRPRVPRDNVPPSSMLLLHPQNDRQLLHTDPPPPRPSPPPSPTTDNNPHRFPIPP